MPHPYKNIPPLLRQRPNWVVWGIPDAPPKAPFNPMSILAGRPSPAKSGVPETWSSFAAAAECVACGLAQGIGYEFDGRPSPAGGGLYGVDLDHVISVNGITPQAREIVDKLASYTEISPSGTGIHIFVFAPGADITRHRKKDGFVEIYSEGRYFTVTGNVYGDAKPIAIRTDELQAVHDKFLPEGVAQRMNHPPPVSALSNSDCERFLQTGLARDKVFASLWAGERRVGNESSDDIALMNKLAYWCSADPAAMIGAFLRSPHFAQKDDAHKRKCQRSDYLPNTADRACASIYSTAIADYERWQSNRRRERSAAR